MQGSLLQGRYQILQPLSQGGFGQTYLAADTQSPKEDSSDPYQENITLTIIDLPETLTSQEYYRQQLRPKLARDYNSIKLVDTPNYTILDNRDGNTIEYITTENGRELQHKAILTVKNSTVYQLTYSGERANFPTEGQTVIKKVQESFKIE